MKITVGRTIFFKNKKSGVKYLKFEEHGVFACSSFRFSMMTVGDVLVLVARADGVSSDDFVEEGGGEPIGRVLGLQALKSSGKAGIFGTSREKSTVASAGVISALCGGWTLILVEAIFFGAAGVFVSESLVHSNPADKKTSPQNLKSLRKMFTLGFFRV